MRRLLSGSSRWRRIRRCCMVSSDSLNLIMKQVSRRTVTPRCLLEPLYIGGSCSVSDSVSLVSSVVYSAACSTSSAKTVKGSHVSSASSSCCSFCASVCKSLISSSRSSSWQSLTGAKYLGISLLLSIPASKAGSSVTCSASSVTSTNPEVHGTSSCDVHKRFACVTYTMKNKKQNQINTQLY